MPKKIPSDSRIRCHDQAAITVFDFVNKRYIAMNLKLASYFLCRNNPPPRHPHHRVWSSFLFFDFNSNSFIFWLRKPLDANSGMPRMNL